MNRFATTRLLIRPLESADSAALFAYRSDPEVIRYQMWRPADLREVRNFIRDLRGLTPGLPGIWYQFGIVELESGALIGDCGVLSPLDHPDSVELGLTLCREAQGKGYATEALMALVDFCFSTLHVRRIQAYTHPDNAPAISLLGRCGFTQLARSHGEDLRFALVRRAWDARNRE